jgi:cold shock CspA family protein
MFATPPECDGQAVEFDVGRGKKGDGAQKVRPL